MARKKRKIRKKRGSRTCGGGSHKKSRGAGSRGGAGKAGMHKGKWTWTIKNAPGYFGKKGFKYRTKKYNTINVGEIEAYGMREIDLSKFGIQKVLGKGKISKPIIIKAKSFSELAIKKIKDAGGEAIIEYGNPAQI
jgi:large subunit ribosomal protein L15